MSSHARTVAQSYIPFITAFAAGTRIEARFRINDDEKWRVVYSIYNLISYAPQNLRIGKPKAWIVTIQYTGITSDANREQHYAFFCKTQALAFAKSSGGTLTGWKRESDDEG